MIRHKIKYKISLLLFSLLGHFLGNQTREKELARKEKKKYRRSWRWGGLDLAQTARWKERKNWDLKCYIHIALSQLRIKKELEITHGYGSWDLLVVYACVFAWHHLFSPLSPSPSPSPPLCICARVFFSRLVVMGETWRQRQVIIQR